MSGNLFPVAGARIFIGPATATQDEDFEAEDFDFSPDPWTEVDGWSQAGEFGDEATVITAQLINRGRDVKMKGTRNAGQMQNVFAVLPDDDGQIALVNAEKSNQNFAFKIEWDDAPDGSPTGTPTTHYFVGMVMSARHAGGEANTVRNLTVNIEINSNVVEVPAAAGS